MLIPYIKTLKFLMSVTLFSLVFTFFYIGIFVPPSAIASIRPLQEQYKLRTDNSFCCWHTRYYYNIENSRASCSGEHERGASARMCGALPFKYPLILGMFNPYNIIMHNNQVHIIHNNQVLQTIVNNRPVVAGPTFNPRFFNSSNSLAQPIQEIDEGETYIPGSQRVENLISYVFSDSKLKKEINKYISHPAFAAFLDKRIDFRFLNGFYINRLADRAAKHPIKFSDLSVALEPDSPKRKRAQELTSKDSPERKERVFARLIKNGDTVKEKAIRKMLYRITDRTLLDARGSRTLLPHLKKAARVFDEFPLAKLKETKLRPLVLAGALYSQTAFGLDTQVFRQAYVEAVLKHHFKNSSPQEISNIVADYHYLSNWLSVFLNDSGPTQININNHMKRMVGLNDNKVHANLKLTVQAATVKTYRDTWITYADSVYSVSRLLPADAYYCKDIKNNSYHQQNLAADMALFNEASMLYVTELKKGGSLGQGSGEVFRNRVLTILEERISTNNGDRKKKFMHLKKLVLKQLNPFTSQKINVAKYNKESGHDDLVSQNYSLMQQLTFREKDNYWYAKTFKKTYPMPGPTISKKSSKHYDASFVSAPLYNNSSSSDSEGSTSIQRWHGKNPIQPSELDHYYKNEDSPRPIMLSASQRLPVSQQRKLVRKRHHEEHEFSLHRRELKMPRR